MTGAAPTFPMGMLAIGRTVHRLLARGIPMGPLQLLRTRGRRSGLLREVPVVVLETAGNEWLVSPFGEVAWVRNVRANGEAYLRRGARLARVDLVEVDDDGKPELLRTYRRRFAAVPFVRVAFDATGRDPLEAFALESNRHPVFRVNRSSVSREHPTTDEHGHHRTRTGAP